jgi:hypothetical protein
LLDRYCPYAAKNWRGGAGGVKSFDIALNYDYFANDTEWYAEVRVKNFTQVEVVSDSVTIDE